MTIAVQNCSEREVRGALGGRERSTKAVRRAHGLLLGSALACAVVGCNASTSSSPGGSAQGGTGGSNPGSGGQNSGGAGPMTVCTGQLSVAPSPLRRLTKNEYNHAVRDLLGTALAPADEFPNDLAIAGFASNRNDPLAALGAEKLMTAAELLAADALTRLGSLVPCVPEQGDATCATAFINSFGRRAYRRALSATDVAELTTFYTSGSAQGGFASGIGLVIERVLQSPHFLYVVERTAPTPAAPNIHPLTGPSLADRLSTFLWQGLPDDALLTAADAGELGSKAGLLAQANRLLADPRAKDGVLEFFNQWLDIEKLPTTQKNAALFPQFDAALVAAMTEETQSFVNLVVLEGDSKLSTLLTSDLAIPVGPLAAFYGLPQGTTPVPFAGGQRYGLLTHPSLMTVLAHSDQTSPVRRGNFIRDRVMCAPPPEPPANVATDPPAVDPNASTRVRFEQHRAEPSCAGCHSLLDPVGFAFENYDAVGQYRTMDGGQPIDSTGNMAGSLDMDGPFAGAADLTQRLSTSAQVQQCMATQWLRYALRRHETDADACSIEQASQAFSKSGGSIRELILAVVQTDAFFYRNLGGAP